jgi:hypothetical protein
MWKLGDVELTLHTTQHSTARSSVNNAQLMWDRVWKLGDVELTVVLDTVQSQFSL